MHVPQPAGSIPANVPANRLLVVQQGSSMAQVLSLDSIPLGFHSSAGQALHAAERTPPTQALPRRMHPLQYFTLVLRAQHPYWYVIFDYHTRRVAMNQIGAIGLVAIGGATGSVCRYLVSIAFFERFGPTFPWGTLTVNVTGSFLIGIILQSALLRADFSPYLRLFLTTGFLGGFTTFSTFAYETYALGSETSSLTSLAYALGSVVFGVAAAYLGTALARIAHTN